MSSLLQINTVVNQGSTGRIAEQIGRMVLSHGWDSCIAYGRGTPHSYSHTIHVGNSFDVYCHAFQTRVFDNQGLASKASTRKLIHTIEALRPDIIHLHNIHGYYLNYAIFFRWLTRYDCPIVWTLHDCWPLTGHCSFFDYPPCDKWMSHCGMCPSKGAYPASILFDRSWKNYDNKKESFLMPKNITLVPVSNWLNELLKKSFLSDVPSVVIHNGVDVDIFKPSGINDDTKSCFNVISVANNWSEPRKGLKDIFELRKRLPSDFSITIVGLTEKEKQSLPSGINGITRTSNQKELAELYSNSDVFVLPTYEDNFPNVIIEALACGTPVITYLTGGCAEALNKCVGLTVPKGDVEGLAKSLIELREKPMSRSACRKWVIDNFEAKKCFSSYYELYKDLLNK